MNRDLLILLKAIYENTNGRIFYILKLDEIVAVFNQNKLKVEQIMALEEAVLKEKVSQAKHLRLLFRIAVSNVDLLLFLSQIKNNHARKMYALLIGGMLVLLSGGIILALSFSLATDNQIEYRMKNGTVLSSRKGT